MCLIGRMLFFTPDKVDATMEAKLVVQALRINTLSKLTFSDSVRFDSLVRDVVPGVEFKDIEYEHLATAIREVCKEINLVCIELQVGAVNHGRVKRSDFTSSLCLKIFGLAKV